MAKKGLAALASKQLNSTAPDTTPTPADASKETPLDIQGLVESFGGKNESEEMNERISATIVNLHKAQTKAQTEQPEDSPKRKQGRPKSDKTVEGINVTFNLPDSLLQELKMRAVIDRTTQKEIVIAALRAYLDK